MTDVRKRYNRVQGCCATPEVRRNTDGSPALRLNVCRDRLCPRCQHYRGWKTAARVTALTLTFNAPRFFTLTLQHREESLLAMLIRLNDAFRRLRKDPKWKARVKSGVWCVQVTRSRADNRWHAHLHLVADGEYFPQKLLVECWRKASEGSTIVHVTAVPDRKKVAEYVARYCTRMDELETWDAEGIVEYSQAMHGRRLVHTFGTAHGHTVDVEKEPEENPGTAFVCPASMLVEKAQSGDGRAQFAVRTLSELGRDWAMAFGCPPDTTGRHPEHIPPTDVNAALTIAAEIYSAAFDGPGPSPPPASSRPRLAQGALGEWL